MEYMINYNNDEIETEWNYSEEDIAEMFFFFNVLKDGRLHVLFPQYPGLKKIPPSDEPTTGVQIKDVAISNDVAVRIFLPPGASTSSKLPVIVYIHGGGFCMCSAFSADYTSLLARLVAHCDILAVSIEYGLFPTRPMPACYDDSWFALQWVASHKDVSGGSKIFETSPCDPWIKEYADLKRIYVGGDSAGANISHTLLANAGKMGLPGGAKVEGLILIHPYFGEGKGGEADKMYLYMFPANEGPRDPRMKPAADDLARLGCERVLVLVAEKDFLVEAGKLYVEDLKKSGWKGKVELVESKDREHCFHIFNYLDQEAIAINDKIKAFIHHEIA